MTAGHVVKKKVVDKTTKAETEIDQENMTVEFYVNGVNSKEIKARLVESKLNRALHNLLLDVKDCAILKVSKEDVAIENMPPILKLAPNDTKIKVGDVVMSAGCPKLSWPSMFVGRVSGLGFRGDETFEFNPVIIPGRSGSPVLNEKHQVIGIVIWYHPQWSTALSIKGIRNHKFDLGEKEKEKEVEVIDSF